MSIELGLDALNFKNVICFCFETNNVGSSITFKIVHIYSIFAVTIIYVESSTSIPFLRSFAVITIPSDL